jgi:DNA polymerase
MIVTEMPRIGFAEAWRQEARRLLGAGISPGGIIWREEGQPADLFGDSPSPWPEGAPATSLLVPRAFPAIAEAAVCHSAGDRFSLPYRVLFRLQAERRLLEDRSDPDVACLFELEKSVRRDTHKMHAFVRFREVGVAASGRRQFAAWFEPQHHILERGAPFFVRRFADMDWIIATPGLLARFESGRLTVERSESRPDIPEDDADDLWRTYFANIFNPARLKIQAMKSEMPVKYWKNLPEARLIPGLIAGAEAAAKAMQDRMPTMTNPRTARVVGRVPLPPEAEAHAEQPESIEAARKAAAVCSRCDLHRYATQTVFGEGPASAEVMFVGEQPGDKEDLVGKPFVGPAGRLLDAMLEEAGIERDRYYVTNAVKHFKFVPRGKRRLHQRPSTHEIERCKWWLEIERRLVAPKLIVALGATAAQAVTGHGEGILKRRGQVEMHADGTPVFITIHPSAVLRAGDDAAQAEARHSFLNDLRSLRQVLEALPTRV